MRILSKQLQQKLKVTVKLMPLPDKLPAAHAADGSSAVSGSRSPEPLSARRRVPSAGDKVLCASSDFPRMHYSYSLAATRAMDEFLQEYSNELRTKLQRNDKTTINMLSMLAEAQKDRAEGIVGVIEKHILTCPPPAKLPSLYLVDSILKNVREPYISLFGKRIAEVFGSVWDITLQDHRASLSKLYGIWDKDKVFPPAVLAQVANRMVSTNSGRQQIVGAQQPAVPQPVQAMQQQPLMQHAVQHALHAQYGLAAANGMQMIRQPQQQYMGAQYAYAGVQQQPAMTYMQLQSGQLVPVVLPQAVPQQIALQRNTPTCQQHTTPGYQQHSTPGHQQHHTPGHDQHNTPSYQQHKTPQHTMQVQSGSLPPVSPGHGYMQQPPAAAAGLGPMVRRSPKSPGSGSSDPGRGPPPPAAANRRTASPRSGALTGDALSQLLSNLASRGILAQQDQDAQALKTTEFQPPFLKELHPGVLDELKQLSRKSAPRFHDVEFQRNKRRVATTGAAVSRGWYLPVDTWIAGTTAPEEVLAANPFDDESESGSESGEAEAVEPEDPDQTTCAISGEPFDKFYDQDQEGWFYRGVRRITGEEAERYSVPDGSLVKIKCLAEAGLGTGPAAMAAAGTTGGAGEQQQQQDALIAAAAAEAPAAGGANAAAAADSELGVQQQQAPTADAVKHAGIKQEAMQDAFENNTAPEAEGSSRATAAAAITAAAAERTGTKRGDSAGDGKGTPAKRAKTEQ